ncbi:transcriptional antitermination N peptide [Pantoea stewartii]
MTPSLRSKHESGSACLPEVAQFAAGFRKSKDVVTAR